MSILIKNIGDSFDDLGYPDLKGLENCLTDLNLVNFSKLINWLSISLNKISSIESVVNEINNEQEADSFKIELSSLLKELNSIHTVDHLNDSTIKLMILNYLCGELFAASIDLVKNSNQIDQEFDESEIAKQLRLILMGLGIGKPPPNVTVQQIFDKILECIDDEFKKRNITIEDSLLFKNIKHDQIGAKVWSKLDELNDLLKQEYEIRRRTLITRSDCSCASFKWKKEQQNEELERKINEMYSKFNYLLEHDIDIDISDLMAIKLKDFNQLNNKVISKSHQHCTIIPPKNSQLANQGKQQKLSLYKFIIGNVPDRGGRTEEAIQPMQETFSQQQQQREQQQQKMNQGNFNRNQGGNNSGNRQNFNFNPNRVQGSGWHQPQNSYQNRNDKHQYQDNHNNRNYGNQGDYQNNQFGQRGNYQQQDQYSNGNYDNQQRGGHYRGGNRNDGSHFNNNRGRGRGRY